MVRLAERSTSYQVALRGRVGPAYRAALTAAGACHPATTSVFLLPSSAGADIAEVFSFLQARGLVVLDVRRIHAGQESTRR